MSRSERAFGAGDRVHHFEYGAGTIAVADATYTIIDFDKHGRRKFVTSMVQLESTDTAAPPPRAPSARSSKAAAARKKA